MSLEVIPCTHDTFQCLWLDASETGMRCVCVLRAVLQMQQGNEAPMAVRDCSAIQDGAFKKQCGAF